MSLSTDADLSSPSDNTSRTRCKPFDSPLPSNDSTPSDVVALTSIYRPFGKILLSFVSCDVIQHHMDKLCPKQSPILNPHNIFFNCSFSGERLPYLPGLKVTGICRWTGHGFQGLKSHFRPNPNVKVGGERSILLVPTFVYLKKTNSMIKVF